MIIHKSKDEIALMRIACKVAGELLRDLPELIKPGISTMDIDTWVEKSIEKSGQKPGFKGYGGFPFSACVSVNEEIIHGFPSEKRILEEGDIVSVDLGSIYAGYYSDAARTYPVGKISPESEKLIETCKRSFFAGLEYCKKGFRIGDIAHAVQTCAEAEGFSVIRDFTGHGIGRDMHEDPAVPNFGRPGHGPKLVPGMVICIEPMIAAGSFETITKSNGWTVCMKDGSRSAHYENTVVITEGEPEMLTCFDEN